MRGFVCVEKNAPHCYGAFDENQTKIEATPQNLKYFNP